MIAPESVSFIVQQETGGEGYYAKVACHPVWPGGASGVTIGVGYDLGQNHSAQFQADWGGTLDAATLARLAAVCGLSGPAAEAEIAGLKDIVIPFATATQVFQASTLPKYEATTLNAFPGLSSLHPLCVGAMVSLVYNRGPGLVGDSRTEMKAIHDLIQAGTPQGVPDQFRAMKRLWPNAPGLCARRDAEATMFQNGLDAMAAAGAVA